MKKYNEPLMEIKEYIVKDIILDSTPKGEIFTTDEKDNNYNY